MGLCDDLDVSKFDSVMYDSKKMNEIRTGLANGVDITQYVDETFDHHQMIEIRKVLRRDLMCQFMQITSLTVCKWFNLD